MSANRPLWKIIVLVSVLASAGHVGTAYSAAINLPLIVASPPSSPYFMEPAGTPFAVNVAQFDPSLGTLQSVAFAVDYAWAVGWGISGPSAVSIATAQATGILARPDASPILTLPSNVDTRSAGGTFAFQSGFNASGSTTLTSPSDLTLFTGSGFIALLNSADLAVIVTSGSAISQGAGNAAAFTTLITTTYTFDPAPVPVPPMLPLFISALAGLGIVAARRRRYE